MTRFAAQFALRLRCVAFGMPVRPTANGFTAAFAANKEQAEAVGIVSEVINDTTFDITFQGEVKGDFSNIIDNVTAFHFLSFSYSVMRITFVV